MRKYFPYKSSMILQYSLGPFGGHRPLVECFIVIVCFGISGRQTRCLHLFNILKLSSDNDYVNNFIMFNIFFYIIFWHYKPLLGSSCQGKVGRGGYDMQQRLVSNSGHGKVWLCLVTIWLLSHFPVLEYVCFYCKAFNNLF